jgi:AcrR family transcriptional regulator
MRSRLVDAALTLLQHQGAAALTVRNITTRAGCSTTGIYTYFGGKNGLVDAIFSNGFASFDQALDPFLDEGDLLGAGQAYRRWALAHPMQYMVMFGRAVPDFEPSDAGLERALVSFSKLAAGVRRAGIGGDADHRAHHIFATVHGYVMLEMAGMAPPLSVPIETLYLHALASASEPIRPPGQTVN